MQADVYSSWGAFTVQQRSQKTVLASEVDAGHPQA